MMHIEMVWDPEKKRAVHKWPFAIVNGANGGMAFHTAKAYVEYYKAKETIEKLERCSAGRCAIECPCGRWVRSV